MIKIISKVDDYVTRANGWVQDSSDFNHLWHFCNAFDKNAPYFNDILEQVKTYVQPESLKSLLLSVMNSSKQKYSYSQIVGHHKSGSSRKTSTICNGIGQAAVRGQKRPFIGDWPADNFLRWALLLGFVQYIMGADEYKITDIGKQFAEEKDEEKRKKILLESLKKYPPVRRIVSLLKQNPSGLTKFEIGEKLGCIGERGFTNIGQHLFEEMYLFAPASQRKNLLSDKEGSSDKYARQICSWLQQLDIVGSVKDSGSSVPLARYKLTPFGIDFFRQMNIAKNINVIFSMLTMEVKNSEYIMKRRALILFFVQEKGIHNIEELVIKINTENISTSESEIQDDISSLFRCGIDITVAEDGTIKLNNIIDGLMIPQRVILEYETIIEKLKKFLRPKLQHIDHDLLKIIDFSYAGSENSSWFENYTYKVFCTFCSNTKWLGGSSRPDVIAEFGNVGLIIDSKAYKDGFSASRSLKDEMIRYVNEADNKPQDVPIKWWEEFSPNVTRFAFQYVSTKFCSEIENQLKDISAHSYSHEKGAAISAANLLLLAEQANNGNIDSRCFESNKEITLGA